MTGFGTDHLKSIKRYVFELQPSQTGLNCRKRKIIFSLYSAPKLYLILVTFCINLKEITVVDILYQCCHLIKKKILRFFSLLRSLFYSYYIRHIKINKKIKTEPRYSISAAKHEDGNYAAFFFKSIS